ncbi:MAG: hypothetical protein ABS70_08675 [Nitrospira sp. SCN 59-13]|nr:MAG: hypothetical protein ABS70_08675 [Nitrospira sp. SCN 59-13]
MMPHIAPPWAGAKTEDAFRTDRHSDKFPRFQGNPYSPQEAQQAYSLRIDEDGTAAYAAKDILGQA